MKGILSAFIFFCFSVCAEEPSFDLVVSLGRTCVAAHQTKNLEFRQEAYPFDWIVTPFDGLYQIIENEGRGFLEKENLVIQPDSVEDMKYHTLFMHDFDLKSESPLENFDEVKEKFNRRMDRFFKALNSEKKILFIRTEITYKEAAELDKLLHSRYPNLNYKLFAIDASEEERDWNLERVSHYYKDLSEWPSETPEWEKALSRFSFSETIREK